MSTSKNTTQVREHFLKEEIDYTLDEVVRNLERTDLNKIQPADENIQYELNKIYNFIFEKKAVEFENFIDSSETYMEAMDEDFRFFFNENLFHIVKKFAIEPKNNGVKYNEGNPWEMRLNGINWRISHYVNVAKILYESGASLDVIIGGLNHDTAEDVCELEPFQYSLFDKILKREKKPIKQEIEKVSSIWARYSTFVTQVDKNSSINPKNIKKNLYKITREEESNYYSDMDKILKKDKHSSIEEIYQLALDKAADRINNIKTMRPNSEKFESHLNTMRQGFNPSYRLKWRFGFDEFKQYTERGTVSENLQKVFSDYENSNPILKNAFNNLQGKNKISFLLNEFQGSNKGFHNYIHEKYSDSDHVFNTANHAFIIKNVYKNIIFLSQLNQFLDENNKSECQDYNVLIKLRRELIKSTKEEVNFQLSHLVNYHINLNKAENIMNFARNYKNEIVNYDEQGIPKKGYQVITSRKINSSEKSLDGFVEKHLDWLVSHDKEKKKMATSALNEAENPKINEKRFKWYLNLYNMVDEFDENPNFFYKELNERGLDPKKRLN